MKHPRGAIRQAVIDRFKSAEAAPWGDRVFGNRARGLSLRRDLPALLIYTQSESVQIRDTAPRVYERTLKLAIEAVVAAGDSVDDILDDFSTRIEEIMGEDETWKGLSWDTVLGDTETDVLVDGELPVGILKITFDIPYATEAVTPIDLPELRETDVKFSVDPTGQAPATEDLLEFNP